MRFAYAQLPTRIRLTDTTKWILLTALSGAWTVVWWIGATSIGDHGDLLPSWAASFDDLYVGQPGDWGFFPYSPAFAQLFAPLRLLPFGVVVWIWAGALLASIIFCARRWTPLMIVAPPVLVELMVGNMHLLYASVIVIGFRWPAVWAFMLLTKITPGIGLVWFAVRREWLALAAACGVTLVIASVSFLIAPHLWWDWAGVVVRGSTGAVSPVPPNAMIPIPLVVRLPIAAAVVAWAALTDRRWAVPIGVMLALPVLWTHGLSVLVAVIALRGSRREAARAAHSGAAAMA